MFLHASCMLAACWLPHEAGQALVRKFNDLYRNLGCSDSKLSIASLPEIFEGSEQKDLL